MTTPWNSADTWIVVIGALSAMSCALLGCFLLLRKMSMMGDAISHAVLPGLAIAFLLSGSRDSLAMFAGAVMVGALTAALVDAAHRWGQLDEGASMGVVFTTMFALGLILIRQAADHVDLDPGCVLYGAVESAPWDTRDFLGWAVPRAALVNGAMLLANLLFVGLFYKELKVTSFDPALATSIGVNAGAMRYALMTLVAATTVAAFETVGSILVIAMLVAPAACAHLLTDRLPAMLLASLAAGALCAGLGHWSAVALPPLAGFDSVSTAGMMGVAAGLLFALAFLFAPKHGILSRMLFQGLLSLRIVSDDVLGLLYRRSESAGKGASAEAKAGEIREVLRLGPMTGPLAIRRLLWLKLAERAPSGGFRLTEQGERFARKLIRAHRLWEGYLATEVGVRPDHVHGTAERLEHITDAEMLRELDRETKGARLDPHDRVIPPLPEGE